MSHVLPGYTPWAIYYTEVCRSYTSSSICAGYVPLRVARMRKWTVSLFLKRGVCRALALGQRRLGQPQRPLLLVLCVRGMGVIEGRHMVS